MKLLDVTLHADSIHRGMGQIMPTARRVMFAGIYTAKPSLMEPMYIADISVPLDCTGGVYSTLSLRRGEIVEEIPKPGTPMTEIRAYIPVNMSFGFTKELRANTGGKAFPQVRCPFVAVQSWLLCGTYHTPRIAHHLLATSPHPHPRFLGFFFPFASPSALSPCPFPVVCT